MKRYEVSVKPFVETPPPVNMASLQSGQEVSEARGLIIRLNAAIKSYSIYPKNHAVSKKYLRRLEDGLDTFFSQSDSLRFIVEKGKLFFKNVQIHEDDEQENNIAYLLSRDGVKWFEFLRGIQREEIEAFIELFNAYRVITPISDGDIVTALWELDFPHIQYEAIDLVLKNSPPLDLDEFKTVDLEKLESGEERKEGGEQKSVHPSGSDFTAENEKQFPLMAAGKELWGLTENEEQYLQQLVYEVENVDYTGSVSEVLMVSMMTQNNEEEFIAALHFLQDRLINTFRMGRYKTSYMILSNVNKLRKILEAKRKWTLPLFDDFIGSVSRSKCFSTLPRFLNEKRDKAEGNGLKYLWLSLQLLNADILTVLCQHVPKIDYQKYRRHYFQVIQYHAERNVKAFMTVLSDSDSKLVLQLMPVLGMMEKQAAVLILFKLVESESAKVRDRASRKLLSFDPRFVDKLLFLLDDPDRVIRRRMLLHLGQNRDRKREKYLMRYFRSLNVRQHDPEHILGCYEILGQCGSEESIPFLKKTLFEKSLKNLFQYRACIHKKGAARALQGLGIEEANRILKKGRRSFFPSIRSNCKKALKCCHELSQ